MDGGSFDNILGLDPVESAAGLEGLSQLLREFQQHRGGDPFVGMVGGGIENPSLPLADHQRQHRTAIGGGGQQFHTEEGIGRGQRPDGLLARRGSHGNIGLHDSQKITSR